MDAIIRLREQFYYSLYSFQLAVSEGGCAKVRTEYAALEKRKQDFDKAAYEWKKVWDWKFADLWAAVDGRQICDWGFAIANAMVEIQESYRVFLREHQVEAYGYLQKKSQVQENEYFLLCESWQRSVREQRIDVKLEEFLKAVQRIRDVVKTGQRNPLEIAELFHFLEVDKQTLLWVVPTQLLNPKLHKTVANWLVKIFASVEARYGKLLAESSVAAKSMSG